MSSKTVLRLATWNIHRGVGQDGRRDLTRTAEVIRQMSPDLIGLQEVENQESALEQLQELTAMSAVAGPTMQRKTGDYGNALLTRLPVLDVERHDISFLRREPRGLLIAHLDLHGIPLQVAVTHLGLAAGERRNQVHRLIHCLSAEDRNPLILMGDFNEWLLWGRPLRWLHRQFGRMRSPATFPARWPLLRLDHILSSPPNRLQSYKVHKSQLARIASDHLPLLADYYLLTT